MFLMKGCVKTRFRQIPLVINKYKTVLVTFKKGLEFFVFTQPDRLGMTIHMDANGTNDKKPLYTTKRLISLLHPFKLRVVIISICALVSSALTTLQPLLRQRLIDKGVLAGNLSEVVVVSLLIFGLFALSQLSGIIQFINYTYINKLLPFRLFHRAFRHLMKLPANFFKDSNSAKIMGNINYDISNIAKISDSMFVTSFMQGLCMIGGVVGLTVINWKLTLLVLCIIPIKILINNHYTKKRTKAFEDSMKLYTRFSEWMGETVHGITAIKLWCVSVVI